MPQAEFVEVPLDGAAEVEPEVATEVDGLDGAVEGLVAAVGAGFPAFFEGVDAAGDFDFGQELFVEIFADVFVPVHTAGAVAVEADTAVAIGAAEDEVLGFGGADDVDLDAVAAGFGGAVVGIDGLGGGPDFDAAFVIGGALGGEDGAF